MYRSFLRYHLKHAFMKRYSALRAIPYIHNKAKAHPTVPVRELSRWKGREVLQCAPPPTNLSSAAFDLIPKRKKPQCGTRFANNTWTPCGQVTVQTPYNGPRLCERQWWTAMCGKVEVNDFHKISGILIGEKLTREYHIFIVIVGLQLC